MAALYITFFSDATRPHLGASLLTAVTLLFALYATYWYWRAIHDRTYQEPPIVYWIDALFYLAIIVARGGPNNDYFFFLSFPIFFVAMRRGLKSAMAISVVTSVILFIAAILQRGTIGAAMHADVVLPPIGLLTLGYLMATWAQSNLVLNRRLATSSEFDALFNPRFSIEQTIDRVIRHVANIHDVGKYALVVQHAGLPLRIFRADLPQAMYQVSDAMAFDIGATTARQSGGGTFIYCGERGLLPAQVHSARADAHDQTEQLRDSGKAIADRFDCVSFCSIQFDLRQGGFGRLYVWSDRHYYDSADLAYFQELSALLAPRIENVQLLDRLAGQVVEAERQKISRDIHDSAIQPYIGLKFGLEALARKVPGDSPLARDVGHLVEMATIEITELRSFVKALRGDEDPGRAALLPALQRQAARFGELYDIKVTVESPDELRIGDALANEMFHIVSEALSNVRRHTAAARAHIKLSVDDQAFTLQVTNPSDRGTPARIFTPRSIAERSTALGGTCIVATEPGGITSVTVTVPHRHA